MSSDRPTSNGHNDFDAAKVASTLYENLFGPIDNQSPHAGTQEFTDTLDKLSGAQLKMVSEAYSDLPKGGALLLEVQAYPGLATSQKEAIQNKLCSNDIGGDDCNWKWDE